MNTTKAIFLFCLTILIVNTSIAQLTKVRVAMDVLDNIVAEFNTGSVNSLDENFNIPFTGVSEGMHVLYFLVKDASGIWSHYAQRTVLVEGNQGQETLNVFEYYIDASPVPGTGTTLAIPAAQNWTTSLNIPMGNLSPGVHQVAFRVRNAPGKWSYPFTKTVLIEGGPGYENLVYAEYFVDADPGLGLATSIPANTIPVLTTQLLIDADVTLDLGTHYFHARVKDGFGQWSLTSTTEFIVEDDLICPYDLNNDDQVNTGDVLLFMSQFGQSGNLLADFNNDALVNVIDLLMFAGAWGNVCTQ